MRSKRCKCWDNEHQYDLGNNRFTATCIGTKECEPCFCGGARHKCDFYPEVREKAKENFIKSMPKGNINRRTLVSKLVEVSAQNKTELPEWVYGIIYSMNKEN